MSERKAAPLTYRDAGVDRSKAEGAKNRIAELVRTTVTPGVLSETGAFGGLFEMPAGLSAPVLVASADGVGTKIKIAVRSGRHDTVGRDLVNHCVNDILVEGARPLFFLDYIGMGELDEGTVEEVVEGLAEGCRENGCALLGGETAEMPDFYGPGEYDLAGFVVGAVEREGRPGPSRVGAGDVLLGLPSSGFHTNGYSLLRRLLFDRLGLDVDDDFPDSDASVGEVLLRVHRSYLASLHPLVKSGRIRALAHITGGGIPGNLDRVLPGDVDAVVRTSSWNIPDEFSTVQELGKVEPREMFATFNMGVGMIAVVHKGDAGAVLANLDDAGENAWRLGELREGSGEVRLE